MYGQEDRERQERMDPDIQWISEYAVQKSSTAFSFLCMFMSILYGGFACIFYSYQNEVMDEVLEDEKAVSKDFKHYNELKKYYLLAHIFHHFFSVIISLFHSVCVGCIGTITR